MTLKYQKVNAKNIHSFPEANTELHQKVLTFIDQYSITALAKRYGSKKLKKPKDFLQKEASPEKIQHYVRPYIETRLHHALTLLKGQHIYLSNKSDPAIKPLYVEEKAAEVGFHFTKKETETAYRIEVRQNGDVIPLHELDCHLLSDDGAWLAAGNQVLHVEGLAGKKLLPFLQKANLKIPPKTEPSYFKKFVVPLMRHFQVELHGLPHEITTPQPKPLLIVQRHNGDNYSLTLKFGYSDEMVTPNSSAKYFIHFKSGAERNYQFFTLYRNYSAEQAIIDALNQTGIALSAKGTYTFPDGHHPIEWLNAHGDVLSQHNVQHRLENMAEKYFIGSTELKVKVDQKIDWFDISVLVMFGEFEIPFKQLAKYIANGERTFVLPNGETAIIPKEWLAQLQPIASFGKRDADSWRLQKHHAHLLHEKIPQKNIVGAISKPGEAPLPPDLKRILRNYQSSGVAWLYQNSQEGFGSCLADDMGLGKTLQTIATLCSYYSADENANSGELQQIDLFSFSSADLEPSLIAMPASLLHNWQNELQRFAKDLRVYLHAGQNRSYDPINLKRHHVVLTTYGLLRNDLEFLQKAQFKFFILDESHLIKNPTSKLAKAVHEITANHRISLTGTPIENSLTDLWSQMHFLNKGLLGSFAFFKKHYVTPIEKKQDEIKRDELRELIAPFILRRTKNEVAKELPPLTNQVIHCEMSKSQQKLYDKVKSTYRNEIIASLTDHNLNEKRFVILKGLMELRQIANHPVLYDDSLESSSGKFDEVKDKLQELLHAGHAVLVFSQFVKHLNLVSSFMKEQGLKHAWLTGKTRNRQAVIETFNQNDDCRAFLISLKAGGVGLNLTKADYVFLLDPWWNPFAEKQAIDRAYRIGQDKHVFSYKFISEHTIEEKILQLQEKKSAMAQDILGNKQAALGSLSRQEIAKLFT